jgi:hypothetical protein
MDADEVLPRRNISGNDEQPPFQAQYQRYSCPWIWSIHSPYGGMQLAITPPEAVGNPNGANFEKERIMRNKTSTSLLIISTLLSIGMISAYAQIGDSKVEAVVPFQFVVGKTTLPAGKYEITDTGESNPSLVEIRSLDGHLAVLTTTRTVTTDSTPTKSALVFNKYGDSYFLHQIWVEGEQDGNQLEPSQTEQRMETRGQTASQLSIDCKVNKSRAGEKSGV